MQHQAAPVSDFDAALDRIRAWAKVNDWKPATLASRAGLADNVTRDMDDPNWSPSGSSVRKLEKIIPDGWRAGDPLPIVRAAARRIAARGVSPRRRAA